MWLHAQAVEFHDIRIQKLEPRLNKCLDKVGDYAEKIATVRYSGFFARFY
jgi:hypothetical protein